MSKLPAFQFYPGDWRKDAGVQALSFHDRGVWFEILCLLHESEQRGKLLLNGQPMSDDALARLLGLDKQVLTKTLTTLLTYGVASRDPDSGALINRRMVRDDEIRKIRKECGKLGGNPRLLNQTDNQNTTTQDNQKEPPSSSFSTSVNNPSLLRGSNAAEWMGVELKLAWQLWVDHLRALGVEPPSPQTWSVWKSQLQRVCRSPKEQGRAIEVIQFSIGKRAKSLCFGGEINGSGVRTDAGRRVATPEPRQKQQPPQPSTLFPDGAPEGVTVNQW